MAGISSPGLGSGLDINGLVTKLMALEQQPLKVLAQKEASYQAKLSAFGSLKGALSALQTAAKTLTSTTSFTSMSASVSDSTVLTASADTTAAAGIYDIAVTSLAKNHIARSNTTYNLADTLKGGTLAIKIGSTGGVGGTTVNVTIADGSTLSVARDAINTAKAGVTATIVNDGTTNRLILTSNTTGASGNIRITATQTGTGGTPTAPGVVQNLTDFDYAGVDTATMIQTRPADNAVFTVNGLVVTRSSNTVTDVISGVTLNLVKEGGSAKLTVAKNTAAAKTSIDAFVKAYNDATKLLRDTSTYNASTKQASILTGDSTVRNLQSMLSSNIHTHRTGVLDGVASLSDIGIAMQKDGSLVTDSAKLLAALGDTSKDVTSLFTATTTGNKGIAVRFNETLEGVVGSRGLISGRTDGIDASIKDIGKRREALQSRLVEIEKRYRAQFTSLDTLVASMQQTSNYLTQQFTSLQNSNK